MLPESIAAFWTPAGIAQVLGGRWLVAPSHPGATLTGLSTDSRAVSPGQVFLALKGDKFNGHDFVAPVTAQTQVGLVIVQHELTPTTQAVPMLHVPDTLAALQQLAGAYRRVLQQAGVTVIAVIGSNGKTTTRHLIHTALSCTLKGTQSPKSFNNHIGVPMTLLAAGLQHESFAVVEVGTNHPGEIKALMKLVNPQILVLTSLGHEHMEFFGTLEGVAKEECSAFEFVAPDGLVILPADEPARSLIQPHLQQLPQGAVRITFGANAEGDWRLLDHTTTARGGELVVQHESEPRRFTLPLPGRHNAMNALCALAVGVCMGLKIDTLTKALSEATPAPWRGQVNQYRINSDADQLTTNDRVTVLNDAYNANPDSMLVALDTLLALPKSTNGRKLAVLGDMLELGSQSPDLHRGLGRALAQRGREIDLLILIGRMALFTAEALLKEGYPPAKLVTFAGWSDDLPMKVTALWQPGDIVLLKASRGMGLERLLSGLEGVV